MWDLNLWKALRWPCAQLLALTLYTLVSHIGTLLSLPRRVHVFQVWVVGLCVSVCETVCVWRWDCVCQCVCVRLKSLCFPVAATWPWCRWTIDMYSAPLHVPFKLLPKLSMHSGFKNLSDVRKAHNLWYRLSCQPWRLWQCLHYMFHLVSMFQMELFRKQWRLQSYFPRSRMPPC